MEYSEQFDAPAVDTEDGSENGIFVLPPSLGGSDASAQEAAPEDDDAFIPDSEVGSGPSGPEPLRYTYNINGETLAGLPTRRELLIRDDENRERHYKTMRSLAEGKPVLFFPNDIEEGIQYRNNVQHYRLKIHGVAVDGMKALVVLTDVPVYFDVWCPLESQSDDGAFLYQVSALMQEFGLVNTESGEAFPLKGYSKTPRKHLRLFFSNLAARRKAILAARRHGYETASDDRSNYFRMVARTRGLPLNSWWLVSKYGFEQGGGMAPLSHATPEEAEAAAEAITAENGRNAYHYPINHNAPLAAYVFTASIGDIAPLVHPLRPNPQVEAHIESTPALARDQTVVMTLDIETHSPDKGLGTPPTPVKPNDVMFMICCTLHRHKDKKPLAQICLTTQETAPDKRWYTVICGPGGSPASRERPNYTYGQDSLIMALGLVWRAWAPDLYVGFNNGQYDDPFIVEKARQLGLLTRLTHLMSASPRRKSDAESVLKWQYNTERRIKISAEKVHEVSYLKVEGCVPLDVRVSYMRLFPKAEKSSLRFFLEEVRLGGKADMPYTHMWKIYEGAVALADMRADLSDAPHRDNPKFASGNPLYELAAERDPGRDPADNVQLVEYESAERMRHVAHYCVVDALRCQELLLKKNVIGENREVGNYSFTSLMDCIYYAGGHKVCNMLLAYGELSRELLGAPILGTMIPDHDAAEQMKGKKYPGAFVVPPEKGLEEDLPITGLDFASLYPSLIRAYNLSPDRALLMGSDEANEREAQRLEGLGESIHRVAFEFGDETVRGWFVRHKNAAEAHGIFARALADLFNMRAVMKKVVKKLEALIERVEAIVGEYRDTCTKAGVDPACGLGGNDAPPLMEFLEEQVRKLEAESQAKGKKAKLMKQAYEEFEPSMEKLRAEALNNRGVLTLHTLEEELAEIEFRFSNINSKQKAVKVFMNTFYGEAGNSLSPIFMLALAGGVTSAGQYNLKMVAEYVKGQDFLIKYGDTDSLYLACPPECYRKIEDKYLAAITALGIRVPGFVPGPGLAPEDQAWPTFSEVKAAADAEAAEAGNPNRLGEETWLRDQLSVFESMVNARGLDGKAARASIRQKIDDAYYEMCVEKIKITMTVMSDIRDKVNAHLEADNGTQRLNMAYEEALHPVVFTGKKKYFGVAHVNDPNYKIANATKIFIRGIDVVKQGQTRLAKEIGFRCMWSSTRLCPPGDRVPLIERIEDVIRESCSNMDSFRAGAGEGSTASTAGASEWHMADFVQSDAWKPNKDNKSVQKFMARMRVKHKMQLAENRRREARGLPPMELDYIEPEPGERFRYLIVDSGPSFSLQGFKKSANSKGDLMEYVHVAEKHRMRVNVPYYLIHYVVGLCARFINYDDRFQPPYAESMPSKEVDKYAQLRAKGYLTKFVKSLNSGAGGNPQALTHAYKRAYKRASRYAADALAESVGDSAELFVGSSATGNISNMRKDEFDLNPQERAQRGIVTYELFLSSNFLELDEEEKDDAPTFHNPVEVPLSEKLRNAAQSQAEAIVDMLETPVPCYIDAQGAPIVVDVRAPPPGAKQRMMGLCEALTAAWGIDRTPAGRKRLYAALERLQPPLRHGKGRIGGKRGYSQYFCVASMSMRVSEVMEAEARVRIEESRQVLASYSERVYTALNELVSIERAKERSGSAPEQPEAAAADENDEEDDDYAGDPIEFNTKEIFACTPEEQGAIEAASAAWRVLLGVSIDRAVRARTAKHLLRIRDRAL